MENAPPEGAYSLTDSPPASADLTPLPGSASSPEAPGASAQARTSRLSISGNGRFTWLHADAVHGDYLPRNLPAGDLAMGDIAFRLYLGLPLQGQWEGVVSLRFDGIKGSEWLDFLYRMDSDILVLGPVEAYSGLEVESANPELPLRFSRFGKN